ncbi:hypothetical protein MKEN_00120000 [Mycena kentingensis (nom. inval.)]|nr:hypothetical protein MKEN_00120000 [Mycena kentingensis (nom. inval.)]
MLSNTLSRPRPPARRSTSRTLPQGASPPPPYASSLQRKDPSVYLGSPLPATLQMVGSPPTPGQEEDWLNEKSREELAELLHKAEDLIRERETELGATSAVCKSLYESNVSLKTKHDALVSRFPSTPPNQDNELSFDEDPRASRRRSRISIHPSDISLLADQNAELLSKLETLEEEAQREQLEKQAQVGPEKIVEELWRKKKEREAKFRAMRTGSTPPRAPWPFGDESEIRDFAPPGPFSRAALTPSQSAELGGDSYGAEHSFEHPNEHAVVAQLLAKIKELEETNTRIIQQQTETADKLHAVQRETESISKVYEYFSPENGIEWEVVAEEGRKSPMDGTIRFRSFRRTLDSEGSESDDSSVMLPRRGPRRKSVLDLFEDGMGTRSATPVPDTLSSNSELSPLKFNTPQSEWVPHRPTLHSELGSEFSTEAISRQGSLYDLSFSVSPSPSPSPTPLPGTAADLSLRNHLTPKLNALHLSIEPPTPVMAGTLTSPGGSLREKSKQRHDRMAQTLFLRTNRWVDGRYSPISSSGSTSLIDESTPKRDSVTLPQRLSSAFDVVMDNFVPPSVEDEDKDKDMDRQVARAGHVKESSIASVVLDETGERKKAFVAFVLEAWLWLQFAVVIVVFLWAMAKRGPRTVLGEADRRAVVKRR